MKNLILLLTILSLVISCNPSLEDLSKYELSPNEQREWDYFSSDELNIGFKHPKGTVAKDSPDLKNAIHIYDANKGVKNFNLLLKVFDGPKGKRLKEIGDGMVSVGSSQFNYSHVRSGIVNYNGEKAYQHEYTTSTFLQDVTRYYQLIYPIEGERFLITLSAEQGNFFSAKKKMHKILKSLRVQ